MLCQRVLGDIKNSCFHPSNSSGGTRDEKKGRLAPAFQTFSIKSRPLKVAVDVLNSRICIRFSLYCELRVKEGTLHLSKAQSSPQAPA